MAGSVPRPSCVRVRQDGRALCSSGVSPLVGSELGTAPPPRAAARDGLGLVGFSDDAGGRWSAGPGLEDASEPDGATATLVRQTRPPAAAGHQFGHAVRPRASLSVSDAPGQACGVSTTTLVLLAHGLASDSLPDAPVRVASVETLFKREDVWNCKSSKSSITRGGKARFFDFLRPARLLAYTDCAGVLVPVAEPRPGRAPPPPTPRGEAEFKREGPAWPRPSGLPIDSEFRAGIW